MTDRQKRAICVLYGAYPNGMSSSGIGAAITIAGPPPTGVMAERIAGPVLSDLKRLGLVQRLGSYPHAWILTRDGRTRAACMENER